MKLYNLTGACPLVTQILLEWIGAEYELETLSFEALKQPEFLAINPAGAVPVLVDGDLVLTQSLAIAEYLNEKYPEAGLHGANITERAQVRRWFAFCNAEMHRTFNPMFTAASYSSDPAFQQVLLEKSAERLRFQFSLANQALQGQDWLAGKRSIADPYLFVLMLWAQHHTIDLSDMADLQGFFARMGADAGVQRALSKQGLA